MSKKPKIYSFCAAGCKWPTVHEDDFLAAATYITIPIENDRCYLKLGKQYKIVSNNKSCTLHFKYTTGGTETVYNFTIPFNDKYENSFIFRLLEEKRNSESSITIVYEIAGVRYTEEISGTNLALVEEDCLYVDNADAVYKYNSEANYSISYSFDENVKLVENERQKSKNLLGANLDPSHEEYGINFTINNDGSITVNGTATWNATFKMDKITLPAGNYFASIRDKNNSFVSNAKLQIHYDSVYKDIQNKSFSLDDTKICDFEFYIADGTAINNETFYIQLEKGTQVTDYQAYNGAIVHEKELTNYQLILKRDSSINIESSTLTTLSEYFDLFNKDKTKLYKVSLGTDGTNNFKTLVGTPFSERYIEGYIYFKLQGNPTLEYGTVYKLLAYSTYGNKVAIGYLFKDYHGNMQFSGWQVIGG